MSEHLPVLLDEVLDALAPIKEGCFFDGTFGAGGYTRALLAKKARNVVAMDRDPMVAEFVAVTHLRFPGKFAFAPGGFSQLEATLSEFSASPDGLVFDIGLSSMQVDSAERGFSFNKDGPLDMRMSREGLSAADLVAHCREDELARMFWRLGEESYAKRIARTIVEQRSHTRFASTQSLAQCVERIVPPRSRQTTKIHPATRIFQALRIAVNNELDELAQALLACERVMKPGARLAVVTFHSLEDRIVKRFFADRTAIKQSSRHHPPAPQTSLSFRQFKTKLIKPGKDEVTNNPRARSARLRWAVRTDQPVHNNAVPLPVPQWRKA